MRHKVGDIVWILGVSDRPVQGMVVESAAWSKERSEYDVRLGTEIPGKNEGCIIHSGLKGHEVFKDKLSAAQRMYTNIVNRHKELGELLEECLDYFDDADLLIHKLGGVA